MWQARGTRSDARAEEGDAATLILPRKSRTVRHVTCMMGMFGRRSRCIRRRTDVEKTTGDEVGDTVEASSVVASTGASGRDMRSVLASNLKVRTWVVTDLRNQDIVSLILGTMQQS